MEVFAAFLKAPVVCPRADEALPASPEAIGFSELDGFGIESKAFRFFLKRLGRFLAETADP